MLDIDDFRKKIKEKSRLMGIDPGKSRIGISISDENRVLATPLKTLTKKDFSDFLDNILLIVRENNIGGIVIGNPINMDGSLGKSSQSVNDVSKAISKEIDLPISLWDERLSTVGAFKLTKNLGINVTKREKNIDKNAAAFILQGAIDFINN